MLPRHRRSPGAGCSLGWQEGKPNNFGSRERNKANCCNEQSGQELAKQHLSPFQSATGGTRPLSGNDWETRFDIRVRLKITRRAVPVRQFAFRDAPVLRPVMSRRTASIRHHVCNVRPVRPHICRSVGSGRLWTGTHLIWSCCRTPFRRTRLAGQSRTMLELFQPCHNLMVHGLLCHLTTPLGFSVITRDQ